MTFWRSEFNPGRKVTPDKDTSGLVTRVKKTTRSKSAASVPFYPQCILKLPNNSPPSMGSVGVINFRNNETDAQLTDAHSEIPNLGKTPLREGASAGKHFSTYLR